MIIRFSQVWGSFKKWPDMNLIATSLLKSNKAVSSNIYESIPSHRCTHKPQRKCNWKNWRSEVLHPKERFRDWNSVWAEQRMFTLSLVCELPRTFLIKFLPHSAKGLGSPRSIGTEKGPLCTKKEVTMWWFYLQLVLTWNIHILILCDSESLSSIWIASKTKGKPSPVITILSTQKGPQQTTQEPGLVPRGVLLHVGWRRLSSKGTKKTKNDKNHKDQDKQYSK